MGNIGSSGGHGHRRHSNRRSHPPPPPPAAPQAEITANRYVFAAATPYPSQYPNSNPPPPYYHYPGYYHPPPTTMSVPLPAPYDHHHRVDHPAHWVGGRYPCGPMVAPPPPYVEHQKAVTIRNDVNLKKESLRLEPDEENPGKFLVAFKFDATVAGSITIIFFAKEGENCVLTPLKENLPIVTVNFQEGLGQKFRQPSGTGINFSDFEEKELLQDCEMDVFPLAVKAEASPPPPPSPSPSPSDNQNGAEPSPSPSDNQNGAEGNQQLGTGTSNSQITRAIFEKEKGEFQLRVTKQILWVNGVRYELQEIYGIGNTVEGDDVDANDPGKECVICLSEPRDTTVLPCRHMCMCSGCAKFLRYQTNRCPICRQPVDRLLEININNGTEE